MPRPRTVDDEQILVAAASALGDIGPARLTLADVGRRVGLSPATLLQRFGSKRGLLLAVAASGIDTMPAKIRDVRDADDIVGALTDVFGAFAASVEQPAQFANHLSFLLMDLVDPEFQELSRRYVESVLSALEDVLRAAVAADELRSETEVSRLARLVHATYNGALLAWGMAPEGVPGDAVRARLADIFALAGASPRRSTA